MIMNDEDILFQLSREQLVYLIKQLEYSQNLITDICVEESKCHIPSDKAVDKIRTCIYNMPCENDAVALRAYIDMKMGKISASECRKIMGLKG